MREIEIQKLAEIGKESYILFHDILNPISALLLYLETIKEKDLENILKPAKEGAEKISDFIKLIQKDIDNFSEEKIANVNSIAFDVIKIMRNKAIINKTSLVLIEKKQIKISSDKLKIYRVLINLISNSIDACSLNREKGKVVIKIDNNKIIVKDNGIGINKRNLKKIFRPNFTTKKNGFGIGLYSVKNIVEKDFKGEIFVKSKEGVGSEFTILLNTRS